MCKPHGGGMHGSCTLLMGKTNCCWLACGLLLGHCPQFALLVTLLVTVPLLLLTLLRLVY